MPDGSRPHCSQRSEAEPLAQGADPLRQPPLGGSRPSCKLSLRRQAASASTVGLARTLGRTNRLQRPSEALELQHCCFAGVCLRLVHLAGSRSRCLSYWQSALGVARITHRHLACAGPLHGRWSCLCSASSCSANASSPSTHTSRDCLGCCRLAHRSDRCVRCGESTLVRGLVYRATWHRPGARRPSSGCNGIKTWCTCTSARRECGLTPRSTPDSLRQAS